jgi:dienelactone hydrolase
LTRLELAPSVLHRALLRQTRPSLAFEGGDVRRFQRRLRPKLRALLAMPERAAPLRPRTLWRREVALGSIEKLVFTAERHADVPAYVCLPRGRRPPYPFVICLQGHTTGMHCSLGLTRDERRRMRVPGDRDYALQALRHGVAALCIEQRSLGERSERVQARHCWYNGCHDAAMQALALGRTLLGERVFDVARALDYLELRGDADASRIGVLGNSGGGTVALYAAALLPRIGLAVPSCSFCSFDDSILAMYHCADNYVPGLCKLADASDVAALVAPRPVVVVAGKHDELFPIASVRRAFRKARRAWSALGAAGACRLVVGPEGHRFYADRAWREIAALWKLRD